MPVAGTTGKTSEPFEELFQYTQCYYPKITTQKIF